jgi:hypothetical protein
LFLSRGSNVKETTMKLRFALAGFSALVLTGCASMSRGDEVAVYESAGKPFRDYVGSLQPASIRVPRAATGDPTGLAPCTRGVFPARSCWRRGDEHVVFPESPPDGITANATE